MKSEVASVLSRNFTPNNHITVTPSMSMTRRASFQGLLVWLPKPAFRKTMSPCVLFQKSYVGAELRWVNQASRKLPSLHADAAPFSLAVSNAHRLVTVRTTLRRRQVQPCAIVMLHVGSPKQLGRCRNLCICLENRWTNWTCDNREG